MISTKIQITNSKQLPSKQILITKPKKFDLEERTFNYAKSIRLFVKLLPKSISNFEDSKQLIRSSGSVGANYIEANEALSKKDFVFRVKIARKEAKESYYWLLMLDTNQTYELELEKQNLLRETLELRKILNAIVKKSV